MRFKGQAVVLASGSGASLEPEPDDDSLCASYTSLVISQFMDYSEFSRMGMYLNTTVSSSFNSGKWSAAKWMVMGFF